MLDKFLRNKMTSCHDPYRELELYLEQAQEEIGKAVKELEGLEESVSDQHSYPASCNDSNDSLLPPPQAFRSSNPHQTIQTDVPCINSFTLSSVNRICHDGNLVDISDSSNQRCLNDRRSYNRAFSSSLNPVNFGRYEKASYSPNTKRRLWQMHPSISFPETSIDLHLLEKETNFSHNSRCNGAVTSNCLNKSCEQNTKSLDSQYRKSRQRSNSGNSAPCISPDSSWDSFVIPRPPSGDVNLLSIWANNLVLELDKSFSGEFYSASSFSPSSDCSLSPDKADDSLDSANDKISNYNELPSLESESANLCQVSAQGRNLKLISMSPDSGIEQLSCETPDIMDESDSSSVTKCKPETINCDLTIPNEELITPPPPEFDDNCNKYCKNFSVWNEESSDIVKQRNEFSNKNKICAAVPVFEISETSEVLQNYTPDIKSLERVVIPKTVELVDCSVLRTTCAVNDASSDFVKPSKMQGHLINSLNSNRGYHTISYMPKSEKMPSNGSDKWSCTLPRDYEKNLDSIPFQRSLSHSAVSTVNPVSIDELTSFMRRMKSAPFQPPSCADVSTDVKDDNENKDAVTQTTPVPLSRSSSFTWVTECDCSDLEFPNFNSGSDESLTENCPNCNKEKRIRKSSSSSLGISSDEDCAPTTPGSGSSSLYLSACSGSSDSFEETSIITGETDTNGISKTCGGDDDVILTSRRPLRSSEITLRGSTLGDISEEQVTSETLSMKSTASNPSLTDSNAADFLEQSASFPSTLKTARKSKSTGSPAQPIEPTVLIINELNLKSISAPVLLRQKRHTSSSKVPESSSSDSSLPNDGRNKNSQNASHQVSARAHSAKELNELQAIEACSWLRAAGFPQYAQMYEDNQFPIDISIVQKDHAFLPPDSIQSLFRRLNTLNRCANMKFVDHTPRKSLRVEESDDEEQYALSENWEFQRSNRRWSRITATSDGISEFSAPDLIEPVKASNQHFITPGKKYLNPEETYCSSHDSVFVDEQHSSPDSVRRSSILKLERISVSPTSHVGDCSPGSSSGSGGTLSLASEDIHERRSLRRSGSDRVKEGAKALLRRMESLKGKRKKKGHDSNKTENTVPHSRTDGSSSSSLTSSPQFHRSQKMPDNIQDSSIAVNHKNNSSRNRSKNGDAGVHSDSECRMFLVSDKWTDANSNNTKHFKQLLTTQTTVTITSADELPANSNTDKSYLKTNLQQNRQLLHPDSRINQELGNYDKRGSYYDNICAPIVVFNDYCAESLDQNSESVYSAKSRPCHSNANERDTSRNQEDGEIIVINNERRDSGVGSSLTRGITCIQAPWHCFPFHSAPDVKSITRPVRITELTAPQMLLLRKLSLLKLTTIMEKFSPSSRTGWSWAVPKFIRRIRNPDYKDKVVFGVPLLLILQRSGQPLPVSIQAAIHYLRKTALDYTGLFRKSGVRSRIQKLKSLNESNPENISYEEQQAYDVADMLKQYFRELPEALLTNKLSETFISIFQFIPEDLRLEAIQAALMLMPDENREVLQSLLEFLNEVCEHSGVNQMTATNLAVCFAPSLFQLSTSRSTSSSPRRRKTVGVPDLRELNENRAAYECLSCMVSNYKTLFSISEEMISQSRISSATHFQPATLDEISSFIYSGQGGLKGYIDSCIQLFLKEAKEKYKGFVNVSQYDHVELSYKKLSDGHPLRLWKVSTEVEAPPFELLNIILRERHLWDISFTKSKVIARLNNNTEIFQYLSSSLPPHPPCDYCVLRSWRTDLPKGACILIETSVNHPEAEINPDSVRALVLASRYFIEPCGSGKSRITLLNRVDTRGRSPEWYNRAYGHICTLLLIKLRNSFSRTRTDGPETKV